MTKREHAVTKDDTIIKLRKELAALEEDNKRRVNEIIQVSEDSANWSQKAARAREEVGILIRHIGKLDG